jgi:hypothetical protein
MSEEEWFAGSLPRTVAGTCRESDARSLVYRSVGIDDEDTSDIARYGAYVLGISGSSEIVIDVESQIEIGEHFASSAMQY